jgi:hypothetical protein
VITIRRGYYSGRDINPAGDNNKAEIINYKWKRGY